MTKGAELPRPVSITLVTAGPAGVRRHLAEVRDNAAVAYYLITRDLKVRYRQTVLGATWAVLQPVAFGLVLAVFIGHLAHVSSDGKPNGAFFIAGLAGWSYLAGAVDAGTNSLVQDINLITKVYIPRLLIPISSAVSYAVDLLIAIVVAVVFATFSGIPLSARVVVVVPAALWAVTLAVALGVLFGAWNVKYRDVRAAVRFGLQIWLFVSPVTYSWTVVPGRWQTWYGLNPAAGVVSLCRWGILGGSTPPAGLLVASVGVTVVLSVLALTQFDRLERQFADAI